MDLAVAACQRCWTASALPVAQARAVRPPAGRGGRPRPAGIRRVPRGRGGGGPGQRRRGRAAARRASHARGGVPDRRARRRLRRDAVREPQPGAGQRDQAVRARRPEAARRGRGRDRAQAAGRPAAAGQRTPAGRCPGSGSAGSRTRPTAQERYLAHLLPRCRARAAAEPLPGCGWWSTARTGPPRPRAPDAAPGRRRGHRDRRRARRADNINAGCGSTSLDALKAAVAAARRRRGHRARRRRRPVPGRRRRRRGHRRRPDPRRAGVRAAGRRAAGRRHRRGHRDVQPRACGVAMRDAGITVVETPVGDRYVLEAMREGKYALGGEQSGHVILLDHATTGDGLLTALQLLAAWPAAASRWRELAKVMTRYPQVLINVPGVDRLWRRRRPSWPTRSRAARGRAGRRPAGCWSGRAAPSRWSGSWSRRWTPARRAGSPSGSPTPSATWPDLSWPCRRRSPGPLMTSSYIN